MKHKARAWTDGASVVDNDLTFRSTAIQAETFKQIFDGALGQRAVDDQTEGTFCAVLHHVDDRFDKSRISHFRSRHEQLAREVLVLFSGIACNERKAQDEKNA